MQSVCRICRIAVFLLLVVGGFGCGSTQQREATEQLLTSHAVDRSIAQLDFRALSGKTVYFDTTYIKHVKGTGFVNSEYIISSLRQQLVAARCLLQEKKDDAEYIVEARIGTLGTDRHEVTYGMPANNFLSAASSIVPNSPPLPTLPELALAKRNEQLAAAKIAAFAYHRKSGEPVWQSGIAPIRSKAEDDWILGMGPFQRGDIYGGTQFAGRKLGFSLLRGDGSESSRPTVDYSKPAHFSSHLLEKEDEEAANDKNGSEKKPDKKKSEPKDAEPSKVAQKPKDAPKNKSAPKKKQKKTNTPKTAPEPAQAKKPPAPKPANAMKSAEELESGLRLRFRFDEPLGDSPDSTPAGRNQLFRLDAEP